MTSLPLPVPQGESLRVIGLNKARGKKQNWGFFEVYGDRDGLWPSKDVIEKLIKGKKLHGGQFCYRCSVTNHGSANVVYLMISIDLFFDEGKSNPTNTVHYKPTISALDAGGKPFEFYIVNDCNVNVSAIWQDSAVAQFAGESKVRTVPLRRLLKSPVDQIMGFFATTTHWVNEYPCE